MFNKWSSWVGILQSAVCGSYRSLDARCFGSWQTHLPFSIEVYCNMEYIILSHASVHGTTILQLLKPPNGPDHTDLTCPLVSQVGLYRHHLHRP